ncbi:methylenetetrahydrofolate reductase (NADPH)-like [Panonychus citri]|uniref:methylenetetrahydrofolate reductase (NADPH)-like n=1 Tax=Panonychus citri TaxID=50023 RepID=UPI002307824C|nr:methylenetetrahydrofolate reductase (NADPH)-like [Panonychus citri]
MTYTEEPATTIEQSTVTPIKLIDKIVNYRSEHGKPFFSLEFFPPRKETELNSFWPLLDNLKKGNPLFVDITWHLRTSIDPDNCYSSLAIANSIIKRFNDETILHLTCSQYDLITMESILNTAKSLGIKNILALRGDKPTQEKEEEKIEEKQLVNLINGDSNDYLSQRKSGEQLTPEINPNSTAQSPSSTTISNDVKIDQPLVNNESVDKFTCALDLVKFIREKFNDYFTLGVAGYPMGHPDAKSYQDDLNYLKAKVDAGSDFIITQLSFSADEYINFIKDCRKIGIKVPIIPGIFPIQTKVSLRNIAKLTQVEPSEDIKSAFDSCSGNSEQLRQFGLEQAVDLCRKVIDSGLDVPGFHFYSLNRDVNLTDILKQLDLWNQRSDDELTIQTQENNLPKVNCQSVDNLPVELVISQ